MWDNINKELNIYGGLVGLISLIMTIFIYFRTGQIKKNIKNLLSHENYLVKKKKGKKDLQSIVDSINEDEIYDQRLLGEISKTISIIDRYALFLDVKTKKNIKNIRKLLSADINELEKRNEMIICLNEIIGALEVDDPYVG